jgi:hypothetical protein
VSDVDLSTPQSLHSALSRGEIKFQPEQLLKATTDTEVRHYIILRALNKALVCDADGGLRANLVPRIAAPATPKAAEDAMCLQLRDMFSSDSKDDHARIANSVYLAANLPDPLFTLFWISTEVAIAATGIDELDVRCILEGDNGDSMITQAKLFVLLHNPQDVVGGTGLAGQLQLGFVERVEDPTSNEVVTVVDGGAVYEVYAGTEVLACAALTAVGTRLGYKHLVRGGFPLVPSKKLANMGLFTDHKSPTMATRAMERVVNRLRSMLFRCCKGEIRWDVAQVVDPPEEQDVIVISDDDESEDDH